MKKLNIFDELLQYAENDEQRDNILKSDGRALLGMLRSLRKISEKELGDFDKASALKALVNMDEPIKPGDGKVTYIKSKDVYTVARPRVWGKILDNYESGLATSNPVDTVLNNLVDANRLYDVGKWLERLDGTIIDGLVYDLPDELIMTSDQSAIADYIKYDADADLRTALADYLSLTKANLGVSDKEVTQMRQDSAKDLAIRILKSFGNKHKPLTEEEAETILKNYIPMDF